MAFVVQVSPFLSDPSSRIHAIWELFCRMPHFTEVKAKCALVCVSVLPLGAFFLFLLCTAPAPY